MKDIDLRLQPVIALLLPFPPSANTYYTVSRGRKILSPKGRSFKQNCFIEPEYRLMLHDKLSIYLYFVPPDRRRRDAPNFEKPICDSLVDNGVIGDDSQLIHHEYFMCPYPDENKRGYVFCEISIIENHTELQELHNQHKKCKTKGNIIYPDFQGRKT